jgi:hypothetical protein
VYIRACCLEFLAFPLFDSPVKPEPTESKMDRFVAVVDGVEYEYVCELDIGTPDGKPAVAAGIPDREPAAAAGTPDGEPAAAAGTPAWGTLPPPGVSYSVWCNICARKFSNRMSKWLTR